ncbi:MAG: hypothetical protein DLM66_00240 [Candidatus Dormiibacter spiritus]|nr:MAG: hypothetical protein DLM66_00240 [Candidatus Dormibacteraeota bacterium]
MTLPFVPAPIRARKVVRTIWDRTGKNPEQPKLRHCHRDRRGWVVAFEMPIGADSFKWLDNLNAISEGLDASVRIVYDRGWVWFRLGTRRIPRKVSYQRFYRARRPAGELMIGVGFSQEGRIWTDLSKLPHLLVGGANGTIKSRFLKQAVIYLAETRSATRLRLTLIDLKGRGAPELSTFANLPHVDQPVVSDLESAKQLLLELEGQMNERYEHIARAGCSDLEEFNRKNPEAPLFRRVIVIDEFADLTQGLSGAEQKLLERLVRETRAGGFHFMLATQRGDATVVPGQIRNNVGAVLVGRVGQPTSSEVMLGNRAAASLPQSPGIAIWQHDQGTQIRVRAINIEPDDVRHRVLLQIPVVQSYSLPAAQEPAERRALSLLGATPGDGEHPPLSGLSELGHRVLESVGAGVRPQNGS